MPSIRFQARVLIALLFALSLPAAMVRAQATPEGTPLAEGTCVVDEDPTLIFDIEFIRLSGPLDTSETGPSLYRVNFLEETEEEEPDEKPAIYYHGCEAEPVAVYVSGGSVSLQAIDGTTHIFYQDDAAIEGATCTEISPPEHDTRNACTLSPEGGPATLSLGDGAFHEEGARFAYASTAEELQAQSRSGIANAKMASGVAGQRNGTVRHQDGGKSIDVASRNRKPSGCGTECH